MRLIHSGLVVSLVPGPNGLRNARLASLSGLENHLVDSRSSMTSSPVPGPNG